MKDGLDGIAGDWDAVVVGAGPAGAVAGAVLAERGWRVLLVERSVWPRDKACGGCLNAAAVRMVREAGLGGALEGAVPLHRLAIHATEHAGPAARLTIELPEGAAVARSLFDAQLVAAAAGRGATFLPGTTARLVRSTEASAGFRDVLLSQGSAMLRVRARLLLACDGLGGQSLECEPWARWTIAPASRIGFSMTGGFSSAAEPGTVTMYVGPAGYVGAIRHADGATHLGASLDPAACHARRGPRPLVRQILRAAGIDLAAIDTLPFVGTRPLTARREAVAGYRAMAIGDACGYVEPFTGEGISWAIRGALSVARILPRSAGQLHRWDDRWTRSWQVAHQSQIAGRQRWCQGIRQLLRRPMLAGACLQTAHRLPWLPALVARRICA
jgi:flavin-dependent dehydrogenase